jgi:SAM-dependent methyltransferase
MEDKYIHKESTHNLIAPREIVPEILKLISTESVIDIGCGIGTFLYCFKEYGVKDVLGVDGNWVDKNLLGKYLTEDEFIEVNLEKKFTLEKKFDLVISLEVAEHISEKSADIFVQNLVASGEIILFSAGIPLQGGQNHVNEQWLTYWEDKFSRHNYVIHDILRPIFWDNTKISTWYKQNMVLVAPEKFCFKKEVINTPIRNIVHYNLFLSRSEKYIKFLNGEFSPWVYIKCLLKSLVGWSKKNK